MDVRGALQVSQLVRVHGEARRARSVSVGVPAQPDAGVRVVISQPADVLSKLSSLQDADADAFQLRMQEVGSHLKAAANPQSGAVGSELGALADQLLRVAKTGDLTALQPPATNSAAIGSAQRALAAYRNNMPAPRPSAAVSQALEYVLSATQHS
jgi:hypothetical protein